jgi:hypothetical protein
MRAHTLRPSERSSLPSLLPLFCRPPPSPERGRAGGRETEVSPDRGVLPVSGVGREDIYIYVFVDIYIYVVVYV